jgi:hypothetical protein
MPRLANRRKVTDRRTKNTPIFEAPHPKGGVKLYKRIVNGKTIITSNLRINKKDRRKPQEK